MKTTFVPAGYHSLTPSLTVRGGAAAIEFYQRAFGATVKDRMDGDDGKLMHAELTVGDSVFLLSDEFPDWGFLSPLRLGGSATTLTLYVEDADTVFNQAVAAGGEVTMPLEDQFYGDRSGRFKDPFGHLWSVATRKEEVPLDEMERRANAWKQSQAE